MKKIICLLFASLCFGQDAVIYKIPTARAAELKKLYNQMVSSKKAFEKAKADTEKALSDKNAQIPLILKFDSDFLLAVPDYTGNITFSTGTCCTLTPTPNYPLVMPSFPNPCPVVGQLTCAHPL